MADGGLLTVRQAAEELGVNEFTARRWIKKGILGAARIGPKLLRVRREDIERLLRGEQGAAPSPLVERHRRQEACAELEAMDDGRLLTAEEVGELAGILPEGVRKARQRGYLEGVRKGRVWLYRPEAAREWMRGPRRRAMS